MSDSKSKSRPKSEKKSGKPSRLVDGFTGIFKKNKKVALEDRVVSAPELQTPPVQKPGDTAPTKPGKEEARRAYLLAKKAAEKDIGTLAATPGWAAETETARKRLATADQTAKADWSSGSALLVGIGQTVSAALQLDRSQQAMFETTVQAMETDLKILAQVPSYPQDKQAEFETGLAEAKKLAPKEGWRAATEALTAYQQAAHQVVATQSKSLKKDVESWGKQEKAYAEAYGKTLRALDAIDGVPGQEDVVKAVRSLIASADALNRLGSTEQATIMLEDARNKAARAQELVEEQAKKAKSRLKELNGLCTDNLALVDELADVAPADAVAAWRKQAQQGQASLMQAGMIEDQSQRNFRALALTGLATTLKETLTEELATRTRQAESFPTRLLEIENGLNAKAGMQKLSDAQAAYDQLILARALIGARDFEAADTEVGLLLSTIRIWSGGKGDQSLMQQRTKQVQAFARKALALVGDAELQVEAGKTAPQIETLPMTASAVVALIRAEIALAEKQGTAYQVGAGEDVLVRAREAMALNAKRIEAAAAMAEEKARLDGAMTKLLAATGRTVGDARETLSAAAPGGKPITALPSYDDPLAEVTEAWAAAMKGALTIDDLGFEELSARLAALASTIETDLANRGKVKALAVQGSMASLTERFTAEQEKVHAALDGSGDTLGLREQDFGQADTIEAKLAAAAALFKKALTTRDVTKCEAQIIAATELARTAEAAQASAAEMLQQAREAFAVLLARQNGMAEQLAQQAESSKCKSEAGCVAALQARIVEISAVGASDDASMLDSATKQLMAVAGEISRMVALFKKLQAGEKLAPTDLSTRTLKDRADAITKTLDKKLIGDTEAEAFAALQAEITAAGTEVGTVPIADSKARLDAAAESWAALQETASRTAAAREAFNLKINGGTASLLKLAKVAPDLVKSFGARLKALREAAKTAKPDEAGLAKLLEEIRFAGSGPEGLRLANDQLASVELGDAMAAKKWKADYQAFKGKLSGLASIAKTLEGPTREGFETQLDELRDTASGIDDRKGKTPYDTMSEQLRTLVARADLMVKYPMGQATHARGSLKQVNARWNEAIKSFQTAAEGFGEQLTDKLDETDAQNQAVVRAAGTAGSHAAELSALFPVNGLTPLIETVLAAADKPARSADEAVKRRAAARDAREVALTEVGRLKRLVNGDARLATYTTNPFEVPFADAVGNLRVALMDVETNLLISL